MSIWLSTILGILAGIFVNIITRKAGEWPPKAAYKAAVTVGLLIYIVIRLLQPELSPPVPSPPACSIHIIQSRYYKNEHRFEVYLTPNATSDIFVSAQVPGNDMCTTGQFRSEATAVVYYKQCELPEGIKPAAFISYTIQKEYCSENKNIDFGG